MNRIIALAVTATSLGAALPATAQLRCWDTGHSIRCPPGCELLKRPNFPGDIFTWRCRRPTPPPPRYHYTPPPPEASCPSGMYAATQTWCCPVGTVYRNGNCRFPQEQRTYQASPHSGDPTPLLLVLALGIFAVLAWIDHHSRQIAFARETADTLDDATAAAAAAQRLHDAADEADAIINRYRKQKSEGDG